MSGASPPSCSVPGPWVPPSSPGTRRPPLSWSRDPDPDPEPDPTPAAGGRLATTALLFQPPEPTPDQPTETPSPAEATETSGTADAEAEQRREAVDLTHDVRVRRHADRRHRPERDRGDQSGSANTCKTLIRRFKSAHPDHLRFLVTASAARRPRRPCRALPPSRRYAHVVRMKAPIGLGFAVLLAAACTPALPSWRRLWRYGASAASTMEMNVSLPIYEERGPRWRPMPRSARGFAKRHPVGL